MSQQYTVNFDNKASMYGTPIIFQQNSTIANWLPMMPLAWLAGRCNPGNVWAFKWTEGVISYMAAETGYFVAGDNFKPSATALLGNNNKMSITNHGGVLKFVNPGTGGSPGNHTLVTDTSIAMETTSFAFGMSGSPYIALQLQPNTNYTFVPHAPTFWIAYGDYALGDALDVSKMDNIFPLVFPPHVFTLHVQLVKNKWSLLAK